MFDILYTKLRKVCLWDDSLLNTTPYNFVEEFDRVIKERLDKYKEI